MKKIISIILIIISINSVGCSSKNISNNEINKMKETIEKVLFYEKSYDDEVSDYIDEKTFNECNYEVFYSYFIGKVKFTKYESEVKSILRAGNNHEKEYIVTGNNYTICMVLNMEAKGTELQSDGIDEGYDCVEGKDVPIEVILKKEGKNYVIKEVKEYTSLEEAQNENEGFKKNK